VVATATSRSCFVVPGRSGCVDRTDRISRIREFQEHRYLLISGTKLPDYRWPVGPYSCCRVHQRQKVPRQKYLGATARTSQIHHPKGAPLARHRPIPLVFAKCYPARIVRREHACLLVTHAQRQLLAVRLPVLFLRETVVETFLVPTAPIAASLRRYTMDSSSPSCRPARSTPSSGAPIAGPMRGLLCACFAIA